MEIIIPEGVDPTVWPFVAVAVVLFIISASALAMLPGTFHSADMWRAAAAVGGRDSDGFSRYAAYETKRAKLMALVFVPLLLLSIVTFVVSCKVGTEENSTQYETMTATLYESFDVANITLGEAFPGQIPNRLVCDEGEPPAKDRPYSEAKWVDADGTVVKGALVNMGNVDGECRFVLSTHPEQTETENA